MAEPAPTTGAPQTPPRVGLNREIVRLAVPALAALAAEPAYILADTAIVGRLGTAPLGGLAVASTILLTGYALFIFLAYGTTASVARRLGAGDPAGAAREAVQSIWLALGIGAVLVVVGLALAGPAVDAMGAGEDIRPFALTYLRISLAGVPALLVGLAGTGYLRGLQDTRTPMLVAVGTSLVNLVLETVLIYGLDFGIGASALSTVVAQTLGMAVYLFHIMRAVRIHDVPLTPDLAALGVLARVSVDLFIRTVALRASLVVATSLAARMGTTDVAAHQVAFEIWSFLALVLDALAIAAQALVGRFLGAGDEAAAREVGRRVLVWGTVGGAGFGLVVLAARIPLASIFTTDDAVIDLAAFVLVFVALLQPVNGAVFALDGILIGASDMGYLAVAMVLSAAAFGAAATAVAVTGAGLGWLWAALAVLMVTRLVTLLVRFAGAAWSVPGAVRA